nr:diguanylate cyclase [Sphingomonas changnyeongensis]
MGLRQAQYARLRRQIPFLYLLLAVNAFALAFTHRDVAPPGLTLWIPAGLIVACLARMSMWLRPVDVSRRDTAWIVGQLRRTTVLAMVLSVAFIVWALALGPYGDAYQQGHIAIFVAVTVLGVIFCLTHHPTAARLVCIAVIGTFLTTCLVVGTEVMIAVAINIALVTAVLLKILHDSFDAFVSLEASKNALIAERRQAQKLSEENARLAATDALTGLPNRRYFLSAVERLLEQAQPDQPFSIGLLDLDKFKPINDTHGHAQGDRLLQALGDRIRALCPPEATVARLGGDEFGLLVPGTPAEAEALCEALRDVIRRPVALGDISVAVGCSTGIATYPDAGTDAHMLFDRADFALYHAKRHGRGGVVRFSDTLETLIRSEQALDATLQTARLEDELSVLFQPVMDAAGNRLFGIEALARWTSPRLGAVSPEMLIATAERTGMTRTVTLVLFDKVLAAMARLPADTRVAFNLSALDLCDGRTIGDLTARIEAAGIRPRG